MSGAGTRRGRGAPRPPAGGRLARAGGVAVGSGVLSPTARPCPGVAPGSSVAGMIRNAPSAARTRTTPAKTSLRWAGCEFHRRRATSGAAMGAARTGHGRVAPAAGSHCSRPGGQARPAGMRRCWPGRPGPTPRGGGAAGVPGRGTPRLPSGRGCRRRRVPPGLAALPVRRAVTAGVRRAAPALALTGAERAARSRRGRTAGQARQGRGAGPGAPPPGPGRGGVPCHPDLGWAGVVSEPFVPLRAQPDGGRGAPSSGPGWQVERWRGAAPVRRCPGPRPARVRRTLAPVPPPAPGGEPSGPVSWGARLTGGAVSVGPGTRCRTCRTRRTRRTRSSCRGACGARRGDLRGEAGRLGRVTPRPAGRPVGGEPGHRHGGGIDGVAGRAAGGPGKVGLRRFARAGHSVADRGEQMGERLAVDEYRDGDQGDHEDLQRPRQHGVAGAHDQRVGVQQHRQHYGDGTPFRAAPRPAAHPTAAR